MATVAIIDELPPLQQTKIPYTKTDGQVWLVGGARYPSVGELDRLVDECFPGLPRDQVQICLVGQHLCLKPRSTRPTA